MFSTKLRHSPWLLLLSQLALTPGQSQAAEAMQFCDNTPGDTIGSVFAVYNAVGAYCVSNFGWSNTWYSTGANGLPAFWWDANTNSAANASYDASRDLFSGDDSPNLRFNVYEAEYFGAFLVGQSNPTGWLSYVMDAGTLGPNYFPDVGLGWQIAQAAEYVGGGTDTLQSMIYYEIAGGRVDVTITTHIDEFGVITQTFDITNNSFLVLGDVYFTDYFNFHPNGSFNDPNLPHPQAYEYGTTTYENGGIHTYGNTSSPDYVGSGHMTLEEATPPNQPISQITPVGHNIGDPGSHPSDPPPVNAVIDPGSVIANVEAGLNNNVNFAGPGDKAGSLTAELGVVDPTYCTGQPLIEGTPRVICQNQTASIRVRKTVPEPGTLALFGLGVPIMLWRRSGRKGSHAVRSRPA